MNILQRLKLMETKEKPTLKKKAKQLIQEKKFIKYVGRGGKEEEGEGAK